MFLVLFGESEVNRRSNWIPTCLGHHCLPSILSTIFVLHGLSAIVLFIHPSLGEALSYAGLLGTSGGRDIKVCQSSDVHLKNEGVGVCIKLAFLE